MKLHLTRAEGKNLITGYGPGWVQVNETHHTASLILTPDSVSAPWQVSSIAALAAPNLQDIVDLLPEVFLLGTGEKLVFPPASCLAPLIEASIGFEIMNTAAACRTYNILMSEGRNVAAALIL